MSGVRSGIQVAVSEQDEILSSELQAGSASPPASTAAAGACSWGDTAMRRKNPQTVRGWARKYKRMHARYDDVKATADAYKERLIEAREKIAALKAARDRANAADWSHYDRALDATTARELA